MKQFGLVIIFSLLLIVPIFGQSTNQDFPSPVLREEISSSIVARDIGDSRLTRHFYTFYAGVGDLVLNVETTNFNGDIDLFEATTFRPISKVSIYASDSASKTSRTVYFRQRTHVVMRVEGRTPNDDPANYRINFSGTFAAATDLPQPPEDLEPKVAPKSGSESVARVNSVGAIIEAVDSKKQPEPAETESQITETAKETSAEETTSTTAETRPPASRRTSRTRPPRRAMPSAKTEEPTKTDPAKTTAENTSVTPRLTPTPRRSAPARRNTRTQPARKETTTEPKVDPLANVRLVVLLKDGYKIERPMSEILRTSVDRGTLVIVAKDGKIERFSLLDVLKFSIEQ
ncbi:MAG: hypothetical protein M3209_19935 [Acidobacteriota bacterium]|nr:hypothetical protein [Acidobacteriota bacterium]